LLHEFLSANRAAILARTRAKVAARPTPRATPEELADGIPLFLDQLIEILRSASESGAIAESAARHGAALLRSGFTVAQVVHDYGGVCQTVTELADETDALITADEFRIFNRCLDDAIAQAVTEYTRRREQSLTEEGREQMGELAHELRNAVGAATVSFEALRMGKVGFDGSTAGVLGRSLRRLSSLVDGSLAQARLESGVRSPERVSVRGLLEEIAVGASMEANSHALAFSIAPGEHGIDVHVDRPMLAAAIANLLQNAFKFTGPGTQVTLRTSSTDGRVIVEVADECGGLPPGKAAELFRPFEQRGRDRRGLGLGLSIARKTIEANGGLLNVRDMPGMGCVFSIDLPRMAAA
jgi:signal transduction histidine kinase